VRSGKFDELVGVLAEFYHRPEDEMQVVLNQFAMQLKENELIIETHEEPQALIPSEILLLLQTSAPDFMPPELFKYTDMQDVLLLDPIHDVDVKGWPEPKFEL
jgi:hypothetical protein